MFAGQQAVVGNVIMCQHDPFRETGRTGGVLHVDNIMAVDELFSFLQSVIADIFTQQQ